MVYSKILGAICYVLNSEEGDLSEISNYRPISLVNTDSKIFTRILNDRIMHVYGNIINDFQLGFIPGKFIAENGLTAQLLIEDAKNIPGDLSLGLLLDQEKAYDRVELNYLKVVLTHYGFPNSVINCIFLLFSKALFFNATHLHHFFEKCLYHTQLSWLNPEDRNIIRSQQLQFKSFKSQLVLSAKSNSSKTFRQVSLKLTNNLFFGSPF
jgi:hypothetical protein